MNFKPTVLMLLAAALLPAQPLKLTSGEYAVELSAANLSGSRGSAQVLSLRDFFKPAFDSFRREQEKDMLPCSFEHTLQVVSLAGPYLSLRDRFYSYCHEAAHPAVGQRLMAFDLRKPGQPVTLTDLFPESALLAALLKDAVLAPHLRGKPATLAVLRAALPEEGVPAGSTPCTFALSPDFTSRFALHHVQGGRIAVRISLDPVPEPCRGVNADLGLLLPMPEGLKGAQFVTPPARAIQPKIAFEAK